MKFFFAIRSMLFFSAFFLFGGCSKNYTKYYADKEDEGLAIFSNSGNNVATCFINQKPWRTVDRKTFAFSSLRTRYEVDIIKQPTNTVNDTLLINWNGYYPENEMAPVELTLHLAVPSNFTYSDLSALQGKRLLIDSTRGFFSLSGVNINEEKGNGSIYFHTAGFDSVSIQSYTGKMSGIFEADFPSIKIERGRFDHLITSEQIRF